MKPITFENKITREIFICDDLKFCKSVDGIEYIYLHRPGQTRQVWMRLDALKRLI